VSQDRRRITTAAVDAMKSGDVIWDGTLPGFGVRCRQRSKSFVVFYRTRDTGQQRFVTLGRYGVFTVAQARRKAQVVLGDVAGHRDPQAEHMQRKTVPTVAALAERFLAEHVRPKLKSRTAAEYARLIEKRILPALGEIRADKLTDRDVVRWHAGLRETPREANHAAAVLSRLMTFAEQQGERPKYSNPVRGLERFRERLRERYLTKAEFERLGAALTSAEGDGMNPFAMAAIRLLIFTGARRGEILGLLWAHVDIERAALFLPDSKTGRKTIQLNEPALLVLANLPRLADNPFVICGGKVGEPLTGLKKHWQKLRERAGLRDVRLHDLRHSFASVAASEGVPLAVLGRLVGHQTLRTTERYAHIFNASIREANDQIGQSLLRVLGPRPSAGGES
jgi:integrase